MNTFSFTQSCQMLKVAPKTLREWLASAGIEPAGEREDNRLKLLTLEQLYHLAALHRRPLTPTQEEALPSACELQASQEVSALALSPPHPQSLVEEALREKVDLLSLRLAAVQDHLMQLALMLAQVRDVRYEQRLAALERLLSHATPSSLEALNPALNPAEIKARSRHLPPLIEYVAEDRYIIVSSLVGEHALIPDSPEWFDWLATLTSFRFNGQSGSFMAYRVRKGKTGPTRSWQAYRPIRKHNYKVHLGTTDMLSIARLEQAAGNLTDQVASL